MRSGVLLLVLAGCSSGEPDQTGEEWARKTLGEGARTLKSAAYGAPPGELGAPYAPRPLVVIELVARIPGAEGSPMFHPLNATLPAGLVAGAVDDVRSLVVVEKIIHSEKTGTITIKRRKQSTFSNTPIQVVRTLVRDEDGRFVLAGGDFLEGHEDDILRTFLESLPQAAPPEE